MCPSVTPASLIVPFVITTNSKCIAWCAKFILNESFDSAESHFTQSNLAIYKSGASTSNVQLTAMRFIGIQFLLRNLVTNRSSSRTSEWERCPRHNWLLSREFLFSFIALFTRCMFILMHTKFSHKNSTHTKEMLRWL